MIPLTEIPRVITLIETESSMVVTRGLERRDWVQLQFEKLKTSGDG